MQAKRAASDDPTDRDSWLRLADDWMKLAQGEDPRIKIAGLKMAATFHPVGWNVRGALPEFAEPATWPLTFPGVIILCLPAKRFVSRG